MTTTIDFPRRGDRRGSTPSGKQILADAVRPHDPALAQRVLDEPHWRSAYPSHLVELTALEAQSPETALDVARRGLAAAHQQLVLATEDGDRPLPDALRATGEPFVTEHVVGTGRRVEELVVPYRGRELRGSDLLRQLDDWAERGITEPSFAEAVGAVVRNPDWLDLGDRTFGLVGAGAAMGPFRQLLAWGARIAAVDLPRPAVWQRLVADARASAGRLLVPAVAGGTDLTERAGVDLLADTGRLVDWLSGVPGPLTLGNYGYADGAVFVRLSVAFDLLVQELAGRRDDLSLAYLATPSDAFLVPSDAVATAQRRRRRLAPRALAARAAHLASGGRLFGPSWERVLETPAGSYGLVDAFIVEQGQNYALAKRLQRWRTVVTRADGMLTSVHVAPPTRTASVHSNPLMAQRQRLNALLGLETFDAPTAQALGAAILVHDHRNPDSPANPAVELRHPHEAFMFAANPGGRWRGPWDPSTAVPALARLPMLPGLARLGVGPT